MYLLHELFRPTSVVFLTNRETASEGKISLYSMSTSVHCHLHSLVFLLFPIFFSPQIFLRLKYVPGITLWSILVPPGTRNSKLEMLRFVQNFLFFVVLTLGFLV